MNRAEKIAYNSGVAALAQIAAAAADTLQDRITAAPTRYNFAVGALEGIVEAAGDLMLPLLDPGAPESSPSAPPRSPTPFCVRLTRNSEEEIIHG